MRLVPFIGFLGLLLLLGVLLLSPAKQVDGSASQALPVLTLRTLDGKAWHQESLKGQVTLVNFFATWCTPCEAEMPELAVLAKQFPKLQLQGVAWNDDPKKLTPWLKKHGNPFTPVLIDDKGEATIALGIKGIPETLIIDRRGMVRYRLAGPMTEAIRDETIAPLLVQLFAEGDDAP